MFAGFNLDLKTESNIHNGEGIDFSKYKKKGEEHLKEQKANCEVILKDYVVNGTANGTKLQDDWFPQVDVDIFISHSHKDIELAQGIAGWLNDKFGLNCFIDSNVWGYADELLEMINSEYSDKVPKQDGSCLYSYTKCNTAAKHVNIMLAIALQKMIDKTEAIFILNTDNCIQKYEDIYINSTYSPWIYTEVINTQLTRKKMLSEYREQNFEFAQEVCKSFNQKEYCAVYEVSLEHLNEISIDTLCTWEKEKDSYKYPLDKLYLITSPEEMIELEGVHKKNLDRLLG